MATRRQTLFRKTVRTCLTPTKTVQLCLPYSMIRAGEDALPVTFMPIRPALANGKVCRYGIFDVSNEADPAPRSGVSGSTSILRAASGGECTQRDSIPHLASPAAVVRDVEQKFAISTKMSSLISIFFSQHWNHQTTSHQLITYLPPRNCPGLTSKTRMPRHEGWRPYKVIHQQCQMTSWG